MSLESLVKRMNSLTKTKRLELSVATSMQAVTADRIFNRGEAADNSTEEYSASYLKQRIKNGYPSSKKVIFQATRQMANDWSVIPVEVGVGLGFKNSSNADKSEWVEDTYDKPIFEHTKQELKIIDKLISKEIKKILNG